jgi:hypothetical protein
MENNKRGRKPKAKKPLDIKVDTEKVDINITRDEAGNVKAGIDLPKVDLLITKDSEGVEVEVTLEDGRSYTFESNGRARSLPRGLWQVTGAMAKLFIAQGFGKVRK